PEILLAARVSPTGKFSNLSVTACPVMQGQVHPARYWSIDNHILTRNTPPFDYLDLKNVKSGGHVGFSPRSVNPDT
ncbi:hypothetical protein, partial [Burkholderia gladioli]|uniref:hypothetical protein n=1 Tax=Burkholderia gladioli TaxID=28095 RepID=UPI001ABB4ED7